MSPSAKASWELGVGMFVVGARLAKSRAMRVRRGRLETGAVESTSVTSAGILEMIRTEPVGNALEMGLHCRYVVEVDRIPCGHVTALLDDGTDSAVVVPKIDEGHRNIIVPELLMMLAVCLRARNPWLRRLSIALHPNDASMIHALRLNGFHLEGEVPGYVDDERGTRRELWTIMLDH